MSNLGFGGAAGVGRPFTIQDLFSAVSGTSTSTSSSSASSSVINQYLDESAETVTMVDSYVLAGSSPVTYDTGLWNEGTWS